MTLLAACSPPPAAPRPPRLSADEDLRGLARAERAAQQDGPPRGDRRAAIAAGAPIAWEELHPALAEAAGSQALQELVLDRMLAAELRRRSLTISPDDIARERNLVVESIAQESAASSADSERLLAQVRRRRGLGPTRFDRLLERTARLRALVRDGIAVDPEEVRQAYEMRHSARYRARIILVPTDRRAAELRRQLDDLEPELRPWKFIELATRESTDASAARGGLLGPISPADPAYPAALRAALPRMRPGEQRAIAVDRGTALVQLEEVLPADGVTLEQAAPELERQVRLRRERLAMDDLARRLLYTADVRIIDPSLAWSWQAAPPSAAEPGR